MRIVKLEAQNFKKLKAVSINPDGTVVTISGANGAGKSSTLDAIAAALGGEKLCPKDPIRRGAEKAVVRVEMDEDLVVERTFRASGTSDLKVMRKDGLKLNKAQTLLDDLLGRKLVLDPLAFLREDPKKQAEVVRDLSGLDLRPLDAKRQTAYDTRTEMNRELAREKARLAGMFSPVGQEDLPAAEVSAADLLEEQSRRQEIVKHNESRRAELRRTADDFKAAEQEVADLKSKLIGAETAVEQIRVVGRALKEECAALPDVDLAEIPEKLRVLEETNRKVRAAKERAAAEQKVATVEANVLALTRAIEQVDEAKTAALAGAKLPVPGLSFTADGVVLNGLPFEQASQAEQLRVSMAVALAMNPRLPIALIRDASLLDAKSLALVGEMAHAAGAQVWLEMVGPDAGGIVIEDGEVAGG
jgi:DNA repair exonuclease SbcCD ATPase subunit